MDIVKLVVGAVLGLVSGGLIFGSFYMLGWNLSRDKKRVTREQGLNFVKHTLEPAAYEAAKEIADLGFNAGIETAAYKRYWVLLEFLWSTNILRDEVVRMCFAREVANSLSGKFPELRICTGDDDDRVIHIQPLQEWNVVYFDSEGKELSGMTERTTSMERAETKAKAGLKRLNRRARWEIRHTNGAVEKTSGQLQLAQITG